ncbi:hypothetical protein HNR60_001605 [Rhodopseudomonas rhenobacensis]|uniref:Uncharacterized protein n=1 Tax=Rhodopseudomonas rhenobacensis TaxID=87461 RepID=A0A7W7Z2M6_9BRAD|nr:hypothetical protein [Rhodopseudomonas rhenobacensis]MBB5046856.1 hypothetical protein [Rhodopseudomonas rhenobacensis]
MTKIRIDNDNTAALQAALDAVNGKASAFTLRYASTLVHIAARATARLDRLAVPTAERAGTVVSYRTAGPSAKSYNGGRSAIGTAVELTAGAGGQWYVTSVQRAEVYPRNPAVEKLIGSPRTVSSAAYTAMRALGIDSTTAESIAAAARTSVTPAPAERIAA